MIFNFLKYIHPTWYFNLKPQKDYAYFPTVETLAHEGFTLEKDFNYKSVDAQQRDLAWRAFQQGFISTKPQAGIDVWQSVQMPVADEYRFFRKNFHKMWVIYVLFIRLLTLHNPFKEFNGFWVTRSVKRESHSKYHFDYPAYDDFKSQLITAQPFISVIIPTLNRYEYLKDVFKDLERQTYKNFEVIVVDQTDDFKADFYSGWNLDLKFWFQEEKALWRARNEAIQAAKGAYILLYDDDSLVEEDWIEQHLKALDFFDADLSSGVSLSTVGAAIPENYSYFCWSSQLDTGNVLLKKEIFKTIGLFDRQFEKQRMGDGEYGLRAYLAGYKNVSNPKAKRIHLKVSQGGLRQMGSWDELRPKNFFAPRPVPSVLYLYRKYFGDKSALNEGLRMVIYSYIPYRHKGNKKLRVLYILMTVFFLLPVLSYAFMKSWNKASAMLNDTSKIELL